MRLTAGGPSSNRDWLVADSDCRRMAAKITSYQINQLSAECRLQRRYDVRIVAAAETQHVDLIPTEVEADQGLDGR
jgi:hypothetical protein